MKAALDEKMIRLYVFEGQRGPTAYSVSQFGELLCTCAATPLSLEELHAHKYLKTHTFIFTSQNQKKRDEIAARTRQTSNRATGDTKGAAREDCGEGNK